MLIFGTRGVTVIVIESELGYQNSNPECEAVCISHSANTLGKGMNPAVFPLWLWEEWLDLYWLKAELGRVVGQTGLFSLATLTDWRKVGSEFWQDLEGDGFFQAVLVQDMWLGQVARLLNSVYWLNLDWLLNMREFPIWVWTIGVGFCF